MTTPDALLDARPVRDVVLGSPYQPGDLVTVVRGVDVEVFDLRYLVGQRGRVDYLEYGCGCGQSYPADPMIGVVLDGGGSCEFWKEELKLEVNNACEES